MLTWSSSRRASRLLGVPDPTWVGGGGGGNTSEAKRRDLVTAAQKLTFDWLEASGQSLTLSTVSVQLAAEYFINLIHIGARLPQQLL